MEKHRIDLEQWAKLSAEGKVAFIQRRLGMEQRRMDWANQALRHAKARLARSEDAHGYARPDEIVFDQDVNRASVS
jgi:hypothetical protein